MKTSLKIITSLAYLLGVAAPLFAEPTMADFEAYPPFLITSPKPNVVILLDNSGSMFNFTYDYEGSAVSTGFDPNQDYYGYFNSEKWYVYANSLFEEAGDKSARVKGSNEWDGNFLNWLTMRRIDIARKVLVGGKCVSRSMDGNPHDILAEKSDASSRGYRKQVSSAGDYTPYSGTRCFTFEYGSSGTSEFVAGASEGACPTAGTDDYVVKVHLFDTEPTGVIQAEGDRVRWGLAFYNNTDGGRIAKEVTDDIVSSMVTAIEGDRPGTWTPMAESLWTVTGYFGQMDVTSDTGPRYFVANADSYRVGSASDPFNYGTGGTPNYIWCAKSFVLTITDGEPTYDVMLPSEIEGYYPEYTDGNAEVPDWAGPQDPNYFWYNQSSGTPYYGSHYIDDVALYGRVDIANGHYRDLRTDLEGEQFLTYYFVYAAFGGASPDGRRLLKQAARNGGFEDRNGNFLPDQTSEYDKDDDGDPDTYFEAQDGEALAASLSAAIVDILRRASSGTAVSILSTSAHGEGSLFQAYFKPEDISYLAGQTATAKWLGYLHGLWVDDHGNMREDNGDFALVYEEDDIIQFYFDDENGTRLKRDLVSSTNPYGDGAWEETNISLNDMRSMWEAGKVLALRDLTTSPRQIYSTLNGTSLVDFDDSQASSFQNYLRASTTSEAAEIMRFIQGEAVSGMRSRKVFVDTDGDTFADQEGLWRLGDIVYSTPAVVSRPMENYDNIYSDPSYGEFELAYARGTGLSPKPRPTVVYVGGNDGMLHAINAGTYLSGDDTSTFEEEHGRYTNNDYPSYYTAALGHTPDRGEEIWAFIPHSLLPHLRWLTDTSYSHVYYVDLKPKIVDARIFSADATHPQGWGTVLICGLRLGGGTYEVDDFNQDGNANDPYVFSSCYFALDITNPGSPELLWEYSAPDNLGFTASYPAVARVGASDTMGDWYVVFGCGPTTYEGTRPSVYALPRATTFNATTDQQPSVYVLDLKTGNLVHRFDGSPFVGDGFMGGAASVDLNLDYQTNAVYIGEAYETKFGWGGRMFRLFSATPDTDVYPSPSSWSISTLATTKSDQPITAAPAIAADLTATPWIYWGTGRFFSEEDKLDPAVGGNGQATATQSFYGVKDRTLATGGSAEDLSSGDLIDTSNVVVTYDEPNSTVTGSSLVTDGSTWEEMLSAMRGSDASPIYGWYVNVTDTAGAGVGERVLVKPSVLGGLTMFTSFKPIDDVCMTGGQGRLYALYYETGSPYSRDVFSASTPTIGAQLSRSMDLGEGRPSSLAIHVGQEKGGKMYIQQSTGAIMEIEFDAPVNLKSGALIWYQK